MKHKTLIELAIAKEIRKKIDRFDKCFGGTTYAFELEAAENKKQTDLHIKDDLRKKALSRNNKFND